MCRDSGERTTRMTLDEIKQLIEFIKGHDLSEFELEQDGVKVRIKIGHHPVVAMQAMPAAMPVAPPAPVAPVAPAAQAAATAAAATDDQGGELAIVKSPIVGTFYRSSEP